MSEVILSNKPNASQELESGIRRSDHKSNDMINPSKTALIATYTEETTSTIRTTCPYCGVGCGVLASVDATGVVSVKGDPEHPANFGKLCSKGGALAQTLGSERRLTEPYYQNKQAVMQQHRPTQLGNDFNAIDISDEPLIKPTDWNNVLDDIATRLNDTIAKHGRDSIMFYVSGQLLTEDYYVANKFIKGFIGNNNIDSNSRLCMSSAVAGHKRAFGADLVPGNYEDLESCDLLVLVGSNMAWCHPILFGRFLAAKKIDPSKKLIVIDPRRTDSCEFADLHLPIAAGTDTHLYNGLLHYLKQQGCCDERYLKQCNDVDLALEAAKTWSIDKVAQACKISADLIRQFYQLVAANDKTVTAFSMGVNQSKNGTDKVNAIINSHLYTGRVGKVGASPFSLTGQPNAMGGREVGALANLLAAHLDLSNGIHRQLVADFWQAPQSITPEVGIQACDAADAILNGRIKAIWIMATNPVVSLPEADKFRRALAACDLVIVSDCSVDSDTVKCADIVLPAQGWGEKSGTVTNSERRISRQRAVKPALGLAKPDWWILSQVARSMGLSGFDYDHPSEIFNEYVALTAFKNNPSQSASKNNQPRYLNLAKDLPMPILNRADYEVMPPFQWGGARITPAQVKLIAITPSDSASLPNFHHFHPHQRRQKSNKSDVKNRDKRHNTDCNPSTVNLRLITGRIRDQWHTMTRTGLAPQLNQHESVPTLTIHPNEAKQLGVEKGDYVQLHPRYEQSLPNSEATTIDTNNFSTDTDNIEQTVLAQIVISDSMRVGDAFMPMHWSNAFASFARVGTLIPIVVDPHSGQPELKNSAIRMSAVPMQTLGKIMVHPDLQDTILVHLRAMTAHFKKEAIAGESQTASTNFELNGADSSLSLPALTWSISRQANSVLITLASPVERTAKQLLDPKFWQQFIDDYQKSVSDKWLTGNAEDTLTVNSAFTLSKPEKQLRFISTQSEVRNKALNYILPSDSDSAVPSDQLILAIYFAPKVMYLPSTHWLDSCFASTAAIPVQQRYKWLLAGRPATGYIDPGPLVCSCRAVGENIIINAITKQQCHSVQAVGKACRAGTNCGSCVGQINALIEEYAS
ncbi:molybdopterin-dependent oxidoreductase [Psychrobacter sp. ANT_H59]|uniref:molybdopterin-dependent oxidoreductase n=1 Tax=Psychrobacter sp. ANT_H59 TaxID=2597354 RepID=UPI0011EF1255|nr:molybdopterin-dependent oxidoreductase [Psychrobacter sp. ANT_H59]KAA0939460.1 molybdopterin-dependent oxidoreductase [Psychrobacter sp. ANT_H59]